MPKETVLFDARLIDLQTHLHLHRRRLTLFSRAKCAYCGEPWVEGACPTKRDALAFLTALNERRRQANLGPAIL